MCIFCEKQPTKRLRRTRRAPWQPQTASQKEKDKTTQWKKVSVQSMSPLLVSYLYWNSWAHKIKKKKFYSKDFQCVEIISSKMLWSQKSSSLGHYKHFGRVLQKTFFCLRGNVWHFLKSGSHKYKPQRQWFTPLLWALCLVSMDHSLFAKLKPGCLSSIPVISDRASAAQSIQILPFFAFCRVANWNSNCLERSSYHLINTNCAVIWKSYLLFVESLLTTVTAAFLLGFLWTSVAHLETEILPILLCKIA